MNRKTATGIIALLLAMVLLFSGCNLWMRPDPAKGLEVVVNALMTRDRSRLEEFYPGVDLSGLDLESIYSDRVGEMLADSSLGLSLSEEQQTRLKEILYMVFERSEYSTELKQGDRNRATVLLKLKTIDLQETLADVPDELLLEITQRALEQGISLMDDQALTAVAVDVLIEHWETIVKEAELNGEAEAEIEMQWNKGFWMPDEDALATVISQALGG